jgi:hypothetical protein
VTVIYEKIPMNIQQNLQLKKMKKASDTNESIIPTYTRIIMWESCQSLIQYSGTWSSQG